MTEDARLGGVYTRSEDVVARDIEGELIIVPLVSGVGNLEDELYTLNDTGREIWDRLDGQRTLGAVAESLAAEYEAEPGEIEQDVLGLLSELLGRRMVVEVVDA